MKPHSIINYFGLITNFFYLRSAKEQILLAVLEVVQISPHHSTNAAVALPYP